MESNAIEISFCNIVYKNDDLYIGLIASCPPEHKFETCQITIHYLSGGKWENSSIIDYSSSVNNQSNIKKLFNISDFISSPIDGCIYQINLQTDQELSEDAYVSDVRFVYECMLSKLTKSSDDCCDVISDDVIRMYLTLYGHTTAMQYGDLPTAKEFYRRLLNCGCKCTPTRKPSCGCK